MPILWRPTVCVSTLTVALPAPNAIQLVSQRLERGISRDLAYSGSVLALTWLNPHVYLDTVLLLGAVARSHDDDRWWFGLGATLGSLVWFMALGFGARALRPVFARPAAWQILDTLLALLMVTIAVSLLREL